MGKQTALSHIKINHFDTKAGLKTPPKVRTHLFLLSPIAEYFSRREAIAGELDLINGAS